MPSAKQNGADVVLRELSTGLTQNIGNVNLYDFDQSGRFLGYTVDAAERVGNGVYVLDLGTHQSRVLSSATADFDLLTWDEKSASLAVLRGDKKKENVLRDNVLLVWRDVGERVGDLGLGPSAHVAHAPASTTRTARAAPGPGPDSARTPPCSDGRREAPGRGRPRDRRGRGSTAPARRRSGAAPLLHDQLTALDDVARRSNIVSWLAACRS